MSQKLLHLRAKIMIKDEILPHLGFKMSSLPEEVRLLIK
jgi:hypothetical protein